MCTPPKVGTTWTQGIVRSLIHGVDEPPGIIAEEAPWIESRTTPIDELDARMAAQTHRRCLKSHTPADGIPIFDDAQYIVVYRAGLDSFMSWVNHWTNMNLDANPGIVEAAIADGVELPAVMPSSELHEMFRVWVEGPIQLEHFDTWWPLRAEPNVRVIHYADLSADLEVEMRRLADWLEIDVDPDAWPRVVERCNLDEMRAAHAGHERLDRQFRGGADTFFFKGGSGRWRGVLTEDELATYDRMLRSRLDDETREWFETGSLATGRRPEER